MAKEFKQFGVIDNVLSNEMYENFVVENFLAPYQTGHAYDFKSIIQKTTPKLLDWNFYIDIHDVGDKGTYVTDSSITAPQLTIMICNAQKNLVHYNYFNYMNIIVNITDKIIKNNNFTGVKIVKAKLNLALNHGPLKSHNIPHVDYIDSEPHLSCTLFIGESDGDHIIFNETDINLSAKGLPLTIGEVYKHKPNRVVYNYGNYHCASPPIKHDFRLALNWVVTFDDSNKEHKDNMNKKLADNLGKRYETT